MIGECLLERHSVGDRLSDIRLQSQHEFGAGRLGHGPC